MTQPRRGLGRGLDALFGGGSTTVAEPPPAAAPPPLERVPEPSPPAPVREPEPPPVPEPPVREPVFIASARIVDVSPEPEVPTPVAMAPAPAPALAPVARRGGADLLDIDLIAPNPEQPRTHFEPEQLRELAESIREHGIIQPLIVTRDEQGGYRLIAGERRLQAARLAGLPNVPVVFREAEDTELLELALVENIQRADLNPIEEAMAYRRLTEEHGLTQEEAARRVGKNRVTVANALRLLALESEIRRSLVGGEISEGHARALLGLPEGRSRMDAWREVIRRKLSVRDTEAHVRKTLAAVAPADGGAAPAGVATARRDATFADVESRLRRALSTRVSVAPQRRGARITIDCYSTEEFENVVETILRDEG